MYKNLLQQFFGINRSRNVTLVVGLNYVVSIVMVLSLVIIGVALLNDYTYEPINRLYNHPGWPRALFNTVPLLFDMASIGIYSLLIPITIWGLGGRLAKGETWAYWFNLLVYIGGALFFFLSPDLNRPDYNIGFVICLIALALLVTDRIVPRLIPRLTKQSWLIFIPAGIIAALIVLLSSVHVQFFTSLPLGFTPDSKQIVYYSNKVIHTVNLDGSNDVVQSSKPVFEIWNVPLSADGKWRPETGSEAINPETKSLHLVSLDGLTDHIIDPMVDEAEEISWSPSGLQLAFIQAHSSYNLVIANTDGSNLRILISNLHVQIGSGLPLLAWSPDGQFIAYSLNDGLHLIRVDGTDNRLLTAKPAFSLGGVSTQQMVWSPNSKQIAFSASDGNLDLINADGTGEHVVAHGNSPNWSPDGQTLYYVPSLPFPTNAQPYSESDLATLNINTNKTQIVIKSLTQNLQGLFMSPDKKYIVYERSQDDIMCVQAVDGSSKHCFGKHF